MTTMRPSVNVRCSTNECGELSHPAAFSLGTTYLVQVSASVTTIDSLIRLLAGRNAYSRPYVSRILIVRHNITSSKIFQPLSKVLSDHLVAPIASYMDVAAHDGLEASSGARVVLQGQVWYYAAISDSRGLYRANSPPGLEFCASLAR
jgi:hypothetical protein